MSDNNNNNFVIDITGYANETHNAIWRNKAFVPSCAKCVEKDENDAILETFLRFQITHKLYIENDNFDALFSKYPGIRFNLSDQKLLTTKARGGAGNNNNNNNNNDITDEVNLVQFYLKERATLGVGFRWKNFDYSANTFSIPILKGGKMWQLMMKKVLITKDETPVNELEWKNFDPDPISCLFCTDYPRDFYHGNFIVNQNILYLRSFIWVDKRKLHTNRYTNDLIMYNESSRIIKLPFLKNFSQDDKLRLNVLGNMAFFSAGKIFTSFIEIVISKLERLEILNGFIEKLKRLNSKKKDKLPLSFYSTGITIPDLVNMYKICKKIKNYELNIITDDDDGKVEIIPKQHQQEKKMPGEIDIIKMIDDPNYLSNVEMTQSVVNWLQFPVSTLNQEKEIFKIIQALKRGEIDKAISQTSNLNKDYETSTDEIHSLIGAINNLDVHRIGRFSRNAPSNSFSNICNIASAAQKVLTKDSKTKEPRYITHSERGFIDLINTADTPKNCGLIVETVLDTVISTISLTAMDKMYEVLLKLFPNCSKITTAEDMKEEDLDDRFTYIIGNQSVYKIPANTIPNNLLNNQERLAYVMEQFGKLNVFRMTQYALKITIPFIELLQYKGNLIWICNSYDKNIYKLHNDGLFYTPNEYKYFFYDAPSSSFPGDKIWVGKNGDKIPNIYGPSIRLTPHPNKCHLPRVGHATYSAKNFVGVQTNSLSVGELHQKTVTTAFYNAKSYPSEIIHLPGCYPKILVASGFNNQEDGIIVRKGANDKGIFSATHYETATIKVQGIINFTQTIKRGEILRKGVQIGVFFLNTLEEKAIIISDSREGKKNNNKNNRDDSNAIAGGNGHEIFSQELKLEKITMEGGISEKCNNHLAVIWMGKGNMMDMEQPINDYFYRKVNPKIKRSLAFQSQNPNYQQYRCEKVLFNKLEDSNFSRLNLFYSSLLTPTIGDKLQTTTANKGVITEIIEDQNTPYIINNANGKKTHLMPDLIINPQFMKRQTLDNILGVGEKILGGKNSFMNRCFSFKMTDSIKYLLIGDAYASGILMNPITGLPYLTPVDIEKINEKEKYYDYPISDCLNLDDGFQYLTKKNENNFRPHELTTATIFTTRYFLVHNHKAANMMQASHPNDVVITDFTGTPVKGKRGGFATGPQEQMTLVGLGAERLNFEISQFRSEFGTMEIFVDNNNNNNDDDDNDNVEVIPGSNTMKRALDEIKQYKHNLGFKLKKCKTMREKQI